MDRYDDDENSIVTFLKQADAICISRLVQPVSTKIEYLANILGIENDLDYERKTILYAVKFYVSTIPARKKAEFVRKCTVENLTDIAGHDNIVRMVRLLDLSNIIGREISIVVEKVCLTK